MRGVTVKRLLRLVYGVTQGQPQVAYAPGCTRRMIPECTRRVLKNAKQDWKRYHGEVLWLGIERNWNERRV